MFSYNSLRGRIIEKYGSQERFAEAVGRSTNTISKKMQGKSQFSTEDISLWCKLLDIPQDEIGRYFFT